MNKVINEVQKELLQLKLKNLKFALKVLQQKELLEVFQKYDGKFYSVRFLRDLNKYNKKENFYIDEQIKKNCDDIEISMKFYAFEDRAIQKDYTYYIDTHINYILYFGNSEKINAEKLTEQLNKKIEQLKNNIEQLQKQLKNIDKILAKYNKLYNQLSDYICSINYDIRSFLEIKNVF